MDGVCTTLGPDNKEFQILQAETEYCNGNMPQSIFYQTNSLYQVSQEQYNRKARNVENIPLNSKKPPKPINVRTFMKEMNATETSEFSSNSLMQYVCKSLQTPMVVKQKSKPLPAASTTFDSWNFFSNVSDPLQGYTKIQEICQQFPSEWTILQLCKGPRPDTTYNIYPKIHESDAAIYMTIMKHARSEEYSKPLCLRFSNSNQKNLFISFASIVNRFKQCVKIEGNTSDEKRLYWSLLGELNGFMADVCSDLIQFFYPWTFLFTGISKLPSTEKISRLRWSKVDKFCNTYKWEDESRVLLSLAATHADTLSSTEIEDICDILTESEEQKPLAIMLLQRMKDETGSGDNENTNRSFPCILIVDERLDHFFWEEINVYQEYTRVNSLQCLWRLYSNYKLNIRRGYLNVNITDGACLINPDKNLQKMESRMRSFFEYWLPHWTKLIGKRPDQDKFINLLSHSCYVYAGHGSGLQYINGRYIAKHEIHSVVFLFGCDSSRLHSSGLYSELVGSHLYYHAAMCPALVGTLMPGLDCNMDKIATDILSRWIAPNSTEVLPWNKIDETGWTKEFIIKLAKNIDEEAPPSMATTPQYNIGSLCAVLARVHQRTREKKLYNTVPYICRGLPVWNCNVESLLTL